MISRAQPLSMAIVKPRNLLLRMLCPKKTTNEIENSAKKSPFAARDGKYAQNERSRGQVS